MKTITSIILVLFISVSYAQLGIGTQDPDASAMLEVKSSNKGFLPPRHDNDSRDGIQNPSEGLMIYNTEENCLQINLSIDPQVPNWICIGEGTQVQGPQAPSNTVSTSLLATFTGKTCFDIGETDQTSTGGGTVNSRNTSSIDFSTTNTFNYTFTAQSANISNVRFVIINTNGTPLVSVAGDNTGAVANGATVTATVTFANTLNTDALTTTNKTALLGDVYAVYDHNGTTYQVKQTAKVRDWQCCGAFVETGLFKEFMCHNLGADDTQDPHVGSRAVQGDFYQWGKELPAASSDGTVIGTWGSQGAAFSLTNWINKPAEKGTYDPCPEGYRVPSDSELLAIGSSTLVSGNTLSTSNISPGNQNGMIHITTNGAISLSIPAAGNMNNTGTQKNSEGSSAWVWTSGDFGSTDGAIFFESGGFSYVAGQDYTYGSSVRCIAE